MASIFTYEPDPPRVASPWLQDVKIVGSRGELSSSTPNTSSEMLKNANISRAEHAGGARKVFRLQAEPQDGPVEYKLHLLLRSRRKFRSTSTSSFVSGSRHSKLLGHLPDRDTSDYPGESEIVTRSATPPQASTQQTRQHRLEQLTTQLLWRLQQSSPHHTSSATNIILPSLPEALPELQAPQQPAKLLHGLEESQGALYEIGVSDDGTLIGLAEDEMMESLNNLRAMAACLGCVVEVLRKEIVGKCEWTEETMVGNKECKIHRSGNLIAVEALVKPFLQPNSPLLAGKESSRHRTKLDMTSESVEVLPLPTEQLRITLTGPTMCGKSSLLGTLTTSTLDNGRGKSRLSMLKHRHEITSGITSSVTQELMGYHDNNDGDVDVINYATDNIASWIDIHVATAGSRLVLISDSAGHPRYRRTTLRGLVGWAPHWTLLCIPADDMESTANEFGSTLASRTNFPISVPDMDLSGAHLDLCLRLDLPLVVVITKLDLASKTGLRGSLTKVLDALKVAGRKPIIFPNKHEVLSESSLQSVDASVLDAAFNTIIPLLNNPRETVPIILTSAVDGAGIRDLHALLHELPIPDVSQRQTAARSMILDVEDVYHKPSEIGGVIVSGRMRCGQVAVGDSVLIGPFSSLDPFDDSEDSEKRPVRKSASHLPTSRSYPGASRDPHLGVTYSPQDRQEWRRVKVMSVRNLRLPVHSLHVDQVGTVAIVQDDNNPTVAATKSSPGLSVLTRIRKGMILADTIRPHASRTFTAQFKRDDLGSLAVGNHVVVYVSSVRASCKVVSARSPDFASVGRSGGLSNSDIPAEEPFTFNEHDDNNSDHDDDDDNIFNYDEHTPVAGVITALHLLVTFRFDAAPEFILVGDRILVMPGGGPGLYGGQERGEKGVAGLDGFVGEIVDVSGAG